MRRISLTTIAIGAIVVLALSDRVDAAAFGAAAPLVAGVQQLGGQVALSIDRAAGGLLAKAQASTGLPVSPVWILGAGAALALNAVRGRARRERARGNGAGEGPR
jgi:hypothetical protein